MFKFYNVTKKGERGKFIGECEPSDNFYFDFFRLLSKKGDTIVQSEYEGRVSYSLRVTEQYNAPELKFTEDYDLYCSACAERNRNCECYRRWLNESKEA